MGDSQRIDVLLVSTELAVGGAEHQVAELAVRLARRGWRVSIVSLQPPRLDPERLERAGIGVAHLGLDRATQLPRAVLQLRGMVRRLRPRLVHSHMFHANLLARIALLGMRRPPLISTSHSDGEGRPRRTLAMRATDRLSTMTTHVSRSVLDRYVERGIVSRSRALWVPNGVDLERFRRSDPDRARVRADLGLDEDAFLWLSVGSLRAIKRHDLAIAAFERLDGDASLVIAGEGVERAHLQALVSCSPAGDRIALPGARRDPEALMSAADGFVLSSDSEALPLVLAEAAACELPIVATDVGGCRELLLDGVSGLLVEPGSAAALGDGMASIAERPEEERRAMGRAGRAHVADRFDIDAVVTRWESVYEAAGVEPPSTSSTDAR